MINQQLSNVLATRVNTRVENTHGGTEMECTLTQPEDKNQRWEEGAAAQAYGKRNSRKLIAADRACIHDKYQKILLQ